MRIPIILAILLALLPSVPAAAADEPPADGDRPSGGHGLHLVYQIGYQLQLDNPYLNDIGGLITIDLALVGRDENGAGWGGGLGLASDGDRSYLSARAIRRWGLFGRRSAYLQLSPGVILTGSDYGCFLEPDYPGGQVEVEAGTGQAALLLSMRFLPHRTASWLVDMTGGDVIFERKTEVDWYGGFKLRGWSAATVTLALLIVILTAWTP